jgi:predicted Zn-dependent protease
LQRTVLLLGQNALEKAIDSANEVLKIQPSNKHAAALLATAMHKLGRKKDAGSFVTDICSAFAVIEDVTAAQDDLGCACL